jgi:hypothetical protein
MGLKMLDPLNLPSCDFLDGLGDVDDLGGGKGSVI